MKKSYLLGLMTLMVFLAFYTLDVHAGCSLTNPPQSTGQYADCIPFVGGGNATNIETWLGFIKYLLAPFLFIFFLVDGILSEINIVRSDVSRILSLLIALIAIFSPINLMIARLTANYTALSVMLFFAALVLLGLSHHYKKRLEEWGYAFGGSYFQMLLAHAPLMVFLFIGGYVVGNSPKIKEYLEAIYKLLFSSYKEIGGFIPISSTLLIIIFLTYATIDYYRYMNVGGTFRSLISKKRIINIIVLTLALSFLYKYSEKAPGLLTGTLGVLVGSYVAYINYLWKQSHRTQQEIHAVAEAFKTAMEKRPIVNFYESFIEKIREALRARTPYGNRIDGLIAFVKNYKSIDDTTRQPYLERLNKIKDIEGPDQFTEQNTALTDLLMELTRELQILRADEEAAKQAAKKIISNNL